MANRIGSRNLGPGYGEVVRAYPQFSYTLSGEITADSFGVPVGAPKFSGVITDVWLAVAASGQDDDQTLSMEVDLKIDGTSVFSTKPKITYISGEASAKKNTVTSETGVTSAVLDENASFSAGDVFVADFNLIRTASPDVEMSNLVMMVEVEPK